MLRKFEFTPSMNIIDYKKYLTELEAVTGRMRDLEEDVLRLIKENIELKDKLSRRNMLIKELRREITKLRLICFDAKTINVKM